MAAVKVVHRVVGALQTTSTAAGQEIVSVALADIGLTGNFVVGVEAKLVGIAIAGMYTSASYVHAGARVKHDSFSDITIKADKPSEMDGVTMTGVGETIGTANIDIDSGGTNIVLSVTPAAADATDWFGTLELVAYQPA
jgi:hypothetical protein